ncbi:membrane protein [Scardovia inopinata]|uniref:DUF805 domain-containing protein n=1 Tax=Scardovia inopinata F0304 TaxID=641146 RepID=W5IH27_SCAIO|nr:DUF805 domain-containing protein [Scardovia inopinata]EFG26158.1 hypothetical protein HMPREF9020_01239 [Scardovia inopinata F0304]BAR07214.1 conserved hypothetical protein [Scardovia inopinata JCM 12537]SUV51283.1 membrane protein [Scardovia inopinata]
MTYQNQTYTMTGYSAPYPSPGYPAAAYPVQGSPLPNSRNRENSQKNDDIPQEPPKGQAWKSIPFFYAAKRLFTQYAVFSGRASRSEFWYAYLFNYLAGLAVALFPLLCMQVFGANTNAQVTVGVMISGIFSSAYSLASLVPMISISCRRLHDSNHSSWWMAGYCLLKVIVRAIIVGTIFASIADLWNKYGEYFPNSQEEYFNNKTRISQLLQQEIVPYLIHHVLPILLIVCTLSLLLSIAYFVFMALPSAPPTPQSAASQPPASPWGPQQAAYPTASAHQVAYPAYPSPSYPYPPAARQ